VIMSAEELEKEAEEERKKLEKEKSFNAKIQKFGKSLGMAHAGIKEMAGLVFCLVSTFGLQAVLSLGMVMHADTLDKNPSCAQLISVDESVSVIDSNWLAETLKLYFLGNVLRFDCFLGCRPMLLHYRLMPTSPQPLQQHCWNRA